MKKLWIIEYENAHWCGGNLNVCVWAEDEEEAEYKAADHMDEAQTELFADEFEEEPELSDEPSYSVISVSLLDENNECWAYFNDSSQAEFYPIIE